MSSFLEFNTADRLPVGGSRVSYGTAELRVAPGAAGGASLIALGSVESCSVKDTGTEEEIVSEAGDTESDLMLDEGQEATITARFPKNAAAPRKGWFIVLALQSSSLTPVNEQPAAVSNNYDYPYCFLITNVTFDWGNKSVRKYTLTCRRWNSLDAEGAVVGRVNTATGELLSRIARPEPVEGEGG